MTEIAIFLGNRRWRQAPQSTACLREEPPAGRLFHKGREKEEFTSAGRIARYA
ncbi:hypothetical protein [Phormidium nigroviride]|uniref:hypothetical protein n=1 Tax=Phormidium nigroviride TaxID=482564 RepID=UPI00167F7C23|nr:hypothetical protein [Oscillatoria nigro-viridis]